MKSAVPLRRLVWIGHTATVAQALQQMRQYDITALPIYNNDTKSYLGIIDVRTILYFFMWVKFKCTGFHFESINPTDFSSTPVTSLLVATIESANRWSFVGEDPLSSAFDAMAKGVHRSIVSLIEPEGVVQRMMTQTDIVQWLALNRNAFHKILNRTVIELGFVGPNTEVVSIYADETALEGFRKVTNYKLWSIAVIQRETGKLMGCLSASDLRPINVERLQDVLLPVTTFLQSHHRKSIAPVCCFSHETLDMVINKALSHGLHRVWIVNDFMKPIGCISFTDVIARFTAEHPINSILRNSPTFSSSVA